MTLQRIRNFTRSGGEAWGTYSEEVNGELRIWVGEDGGRLRTSHDGGVNWRFADTPSDFTGNIFDIWFFPGGVHGFATGRNGRVLETQDGGMSYQYYGVPVIDVSGHMGDPASLWGVRALSEDVVFVSGLWAFMYTVDRGQTWHKINVYDRNPSLTGALLISLMDLELFRLDIIGSIGSFVGSVGATWERSDGDRGVALFTDSALPESNSGRNWWITLDDTTQPISIHSGAVMPQPWSLRFERGATSTTNSTGYVVGGRGGNFPSRWYRTTDSGRTWTPGGEFPVTAYDVTSDASGQGMIVGYSGQYATRDPGTGTWTGGVMPSSSPHFPTPWLSTGALLAASSFGASGLIAVGDFGSQRISSDYGATWTSMSDLYPGSDELEQRVYDCDFLESAPLVGCMVGQLSRILRTDDGGCTWTIAQPERRTKLNAIDLDDAGRGVAVGEAGLIYYSSDFGVSWTRVIFPPNTIFPIGVSLRDISLKDVTLVGTTEAWAVGSFRNKPIVAYSSDGGATWAWVGTPTSGNLQLTGVAFANPLEGLVVGFNNIAGTGNTRARSYRVDLTGGGLVWTNVSPPSPTTTARLLDIDLVGSSLGSATAVAVGNDSLILEWNGTDWSTAGASGVNSGTDYYAVAISPSGNTVLVGGNYDVDLSTASDKGLMFRRDANGWGQIRAFCGKDIQGISLTSDDQGFVMGQTGVGSDSFINGNLGSSILLRYDAN